MLSGGQERRAHRIFAGNHTSRTFCVILTPGRPHTATHTAISCAILSMALCALSETLDTVPGT